MQKGCRLSLFIIIAFFIITIILAYRVFFIPHGIEINHSKFPVFGIDVSEHTGIINFETLKSNSKQKLQFVYIKATEGKNYRDKKFESNYINAKNTNLKIGVYHFFRFNVCGKQQALNLVEAISNKEIDLPIAIDIEKWGNKKANKSMVINAVNEFIETLTSYGYGRTVIYSNEDGYKTYIKNNFSENDLWICSFNTQFTKNNQWKFWQYSHKGKIIGAEGYIDYNVFNGSVDEWNEYID